MSLIERDEKRLEAAFLQDRFYTLQRWTRNENHIQLFVSIVPSQKGTDGRYIFGMEYKEELDIGKKYRKIFKISKSGDEQLWETELDESADLAELSQAHYYKLRHFYNKAYKEVSKNEGVLEHEVDDIVTLEMLKYIEHLEIEDRPIGREGDCVVYIERREPLGRSAAIRKKVKQMFIVEKRDHVNFIPKFHCKTLIYAPRNGYNNEEFLQFKSARSYVRIGDLTPENIVDFVKAWQKKKIRKNFDWFVWNTNNSDFDREKLWKLLGGVDTSEPIELKQNKKNRKIARLHCTDTELRFFTDKRPEVAKGFSWSRLSQKIQNTLFKSQLAEKSVKIRAGC